MQEYIEFNKVIKQNGCYICEFWKQWKIWQTDRLFLNLSDKLNLKNSNKICCCLLNLSKYYTWKNIKTFNI